MGQITPRVVTTFPGNVFALAFSPDGQRLATASGVNAAQIHAVADGSLVSTLTSNIDVYDVGFGPDGMIAAASTTEAGVPGRRSVVVFNPSTGTALWRLDGQDDTRVLFSPDGNNVVLCQRANVARPGGSVQACDARTGVQKWRFDVAPPNILYSAAISFDGAIVAAGIGGKDESTGGIVLLDAASGAQSKHVAMPSHVRAMSFSALSRKLLFGADNEIGIIDLDAGDFLRVLPNPQVPQGDNLSAVSSIIFSADDRLIGEVTWNSIRAKIRVLDTDTLAVQYELANCLSPVLAFSTDSRSVLVSTGFVSTGPDWRLWDAATKLEQFVALPLPGSSEIREGVLAPIGVLGAVAGNGGVTVFELPVVERVRFVHDGRVRAVAFNADGSRVLTGSEDMTARVFDTAGGTQVSPSFTHGGPVVSVVWIPDQPWVATASSDHTARIFDTTTATERAHSTHDGAVNVVCVSADGHWLASGGDDGVLVTEVATGKLSSRLTHNAAVQAVVFSPDGARLATGCEDGAARLFNSANGTELMTFPHGDGNAVGAVAFSPDGTRLATGCADGSARVFNTADGTPVSSVSCGSPVRAVVFSPDGTQLAVGDGNKFARIVVSGSGAEVHTFPHDGAVQALGYNPAGTVLVTGSADATARVFNTSTGQELRRFVHDAAVRAVSVDHTGLVVATASDDHTARIWDIPAV